MVARRSATASLPRGRLRGDITHPDYDFLDLRLNDYYARLHAAARPWLDGAGISHELNWVREECETARRLVDGLRGVADYVRALPDLTAESNAALFDLVEASSVAFEEDHDHALLDAAACRDTCERLRRRLLGLRDAFVSDNADELMAEVNAGGIALAG